MLGEKVWNSVRCKVASLLCNQVTVPFKYEGATLHRIPLIFGPGVGPCSLESAGLMLNAAK